MSTQDRINGLTGNLGFKAPVRVATTANITLSGLQTIDGIVLVAEDRVLVKDQTDTTENGIYNVQSTAWVRSPDFDGQRDILEGTMAYVTSGTVGAKSAWAVLTSSPSIGSAIAFGPAVLVGAVSSAVSFLQAGAGAVASTVEGKLRLFITPSDFGASADDSTDDFTALQAAIDHAISLGGHEVVINLCGRRYRISQTLVFTAGASGVSIINGRVGPTASFVSGPGFHVPTGSGNIRIADIFIDGRDSSLNLLCDGILSDAGSNTFERIQGRGFPLYGIKVTGGSDVKITGCSLLQWKLSDSENGTQANRTAIMYWLQTGDISVSNCVGSFCLYPVKCEGVGQQFYDCHFYNGATSGDVVTTYRQYNVFVVSGCSPKFNNCYLDRGTVLLQNFYVSFTDCTIINDDTRTFSPVIFEFNPQASNKKLNGLQITGMKLIGDVAGSALTASDMFEVNTADGTLKATDSSVNIYVTNNVYHVNDTQGNFIPSTKGSVKVVIATGNWTSASGAYKATIDLSSYMFLPAHLSYAITVGNIGEAPAPYTAPHVWLIRTGTGTYEIWCATNESQNIYVNFSAEAIATITI